VFDRDGGRSGRTKRAAARLKVARRLTCVSRAQQFSARRVPNPNACSGRRSWGRPSPRQTAGIEPAISLARLIDLRQRPSGLRTCTPQLPAGSPWRSTCARAAALWSVPTCRSWPRPAARPTRRWPTRSSRNTVPRVLRRQQSGPGARTRGPTPESRTFCVPACASERGKRDAALSRANAGLRVTPPEFAFSAADRSQACGRLRGSGSRRTWCFGWRLLCSEPCTDICLERDMSGGAAPPGDCSATHWNLTASGGGASRCFAPCWCLRSWCPALS